MAQVVLLDEAEVFLQERSLSDLPRNALVAGRCRGIGYIISANHEASFPANTRIL